MTTHKLGLYVSHFMKQLILCPRHQGDDDLRYKHYEDMCNHLSENLQRYVPTDRARDISLMLIKHVNKTYTELMKYTDTKEECQKVAPLVLKSVLHPSVNDIDAIHSITHPNITDYYKVENSELIYRALPLFRGLKAVRLGEADRNDNMTLNVEGFRSTLETFSSRSCLDSDVETLANKCKSLRCLDISCSENVTDRIVDYILNFENLEELNLCEIDSLSCKDLDRLLNGMADVELSDNEEFSKEFKFLPSIGIDCSEDNGFSSGRTNLKTPRSQLLKNFGCDSVRKGHIALISQKFSNLTSLSLSNIYTCVLTPLRNLQHLRAFTLIGSVFFLVEDLLKAAGYRLTCLSIIDVIGTDFNFLCEKCPSLVCLHLFFDSDKSLLLPPEPNQNKPDNTQLPTILSLKFLQIYLHEYDTVSYILKCFGNLRKLIVGHARYEKELLGSILRRKHLVHLEELFWGNRVVVSFNGGVISATCFQEDVGKIIQTVRTLHI